MLRHLAGEGVWGCWSSDLDRVALQPSTHWFVSSVYLLLTRARARRVNEEGFRPCGAGGGGHPVITGNSNKDSQGNRAACLVVC